MMKKILFPLILSLILVLPGYAEVAPSKATPSKATQPISDIISSLAKAAKSALVIRTTKDPKVRETLIGKQGEILIPISTVPTIIPGPGPGLMNPAAGNTAVGQTPDNQQGAEAGGNQAKSKDYRRLGRWGGGGGGVGGGGLGADNSTRRNDSSNPQDGNILGGGGLISSPATTNPGLGATFIPSGTPATVTTDVASTDSTATDSVTDSVTDPVTVTPTLPSTDLQALLDRSVSDAGVPGAIVAVQTKWGTWIGAAGKADLDTSAPMTADMQVRLAGSTKLFTAALIMQLAQENKISLTDTVDKWVPGQVWNGDLITIGMLLNHTSGIHDHETTPEFVDSLLWGPTIPWTAADVMTITDSYLPDFDPGTAFEFCNTNYYVLGMIAEAATGDTVEHLIQSRFCDPLGLSRTALTTDGFKTEPYSRDYCWFGTPAYPTLTETSAWDLSFDWTSGAGVSTAQDMVTWIKALFGGQVVNSNSLTQMTTPQTPATTYGYGLEVEASDSRFGEKMYNQTGENPGVYTRWLYYPNSGRIVFIYLNRCDKRFLSTDPPPQVDASKAADALLDGISNLLIQSQSQ